MQNERNHLTLANHNQDLLDKLVDDVDQFPDWVATVAFYKALHVVEAVFACETPTRHGIDHVTRERLLKSDRKYEAIYRHYRILVAGSMIARYMQDDQTCFTHFMTPDQVVNQLLQHRLHELEKSASKKLRNPRVLVTFASKHLPGSDPQSNPA